MRFPFPVTPDETGGGRVISFVSATPGAGSSTLACLTSLAVKENNKKVALVDLNPAGKVRAYMGLTVDVSPASVLDVAGIKSADEINKVGVAHPRGLFVLPGVTRLLDATQVDSKLVLRVLTLVRKAFPVTITALGPLHLSGWIGVLLSDVICLVLRPDRSDLDMFREQMEFLSRLGCAERTKIVLNQSGAAGGLRDNEIREIVKPDVVIAQDHAIRAGCNKRYPAPGKHKRSLRSLVD